MDGNLTRECHNFHSTQISLLINTEVKNKLLQINMKSCEGRKVNLSKKMDFIQLRRNICHWARENTLLENVK